MNLIFISPNFPDQFWQFCDRLRQNGFTVLGVGDSPYDDLSPELRSALTEYYKVDTLENYDSVFRAVAFFSFKYGKIDWIESNNEYWLRMDARLRRDFNITTGVHPDQLALWQSKSAMKPVYRSAGIPTARSWLVTDPASTRAAIDANGGFPVFAKPDTGVGASDTYRIDDEADLDAFFRNKPDVQYVMEDYVFGDIYTYDAICDANGDPVFESSFRCPNVAESVNNDEEVFIFVTPDVPDQLMDYGRKAIKAFGVSSRFVHFEFFRLTRARKGLGEVGDFAGLEVNMRPPGGYIPDMMNYAHSADVYRIWADMIAGKAIPVRVSDGDSDDQSSGSFKENGDGHCGGPHRFCAYAARKDSHRYRTTHDDVIARFGSSIVMDRRIPDILSAAMGNQMYAALFDTIEEVREFEEFVLSS